MKVLTRIIILSLMLLVLLTTFVTAGHNVLIQNASQNFNIHITITPKATIYSTSSSKAPSIQSNVPYQTQQQRTTSGQIMQVIEF